ncbi:hypothetical protein KL86DPRO_10291 [uncultured delta proteobacterium]|uniref:Uncharacterized protein n=1 Tax=uncultured delta proteobacterium TaxID=34034 RepID=A0A212IXZ8_9DELT|nr:hypothetical protein KL86DPRO_10291 [uncultured delta proteobacterium]
MYLFLIAYFYDNTTRFQQWKNEIKRVASLLNRNFYTNKIDGVTIQYVLHGGLVAAIQHAGAAVFIMKPPSPHPFFTPLQLPAPETACRPGATANKSFLWCSL